MTQNLQDKQAFFGCYIHGSYSRDIINRDGEINTVGPYDVLDRLSDIELMDYFDSSYINVSEVNDYLHLKSLSAITDEDAIEVQKLNPWSDMREGMSDEQELLEYIEHAKSMVIQSVALPVTIIDFLRSRSYLLPFRQYSEQQLLDMGWAKLKTKV